MERVLIGRCRFDGIIGHNAAEFVDLLPHGLGFFCRGVKQSTEFFGRAAQKFLCKNGSLCAFLHAL